MAGLASGGLAGLAGCSGLPNPFGSSGLGFTDLPRPGSTDPVYREWLPAPAELDDDAYGSLVASPAQFRSLGDAVPGGFWQHRREIQLRLDYLGVGFDDYDWVVLAGETSVVAASFDRGAVESAVDDAGYDPAGEHRGFALFDRDDRPRTVAVGDGHLVWSEGWDPGPERDTLAPTTTVRRFVDAYRGDRPRYPDTDEGLGTLASGIGTPPFAITKPDGAGTFHFYLGEPREWDLPELLATGSAWTFDEDRTYLWGVLTFEEGRPVLAQKVENEIQERSDRYGHFDSVDVWTEGANANVLFAMDDGAYGTRLPGLDPSTTVPQVTWGYDHDPDAGTVTLRHEAGTAVPVDRLRVVGGPDAVFDEYETVGPGDAVAFDEADLGGDLEVGWVQGDPSALHQLARYELA